MKRCKVIVTARSFGMADQEAERLLQENNCEIVRIKAGDKSVEEQVKEEIKTADAVIAGLEEYGKELILSAPNLKVISRYGVGYDKVDIEAANVANVVVSITPGANSDSVADLAMALMLNAGRSVALMDRGIRGREMVRPQGVEMWQKTVGILGTGRIGQGVAERCSGFRMRILGYDMFQNSDFEKKLGGTYVGLDELLCESDFITVHLPLTPETKNLIGRKQFQMMKKDAVLVNTARGGIVDEEALFEALKSGRIRGAGLDATVVEPPYDSPLMSLENCILTPHAGAATKEASSRMSLMAAQNVVDVLNTGTCAYRVLC